MAQKEAAATMTKVAIAETYAVACPECASQLHRLVEWSARDNQVTSLTFKVVPRCEHALPAVKTTEIRSISGPASNSSQQTPTPPGGAVLFPMPEKPLESLAGTGYDEPSAVS